MTIAESEARIWYQTEVPPTARTPWDLMVDHERKWWTKAYTAARDAGLEAAEKAILSGIGPHDDPESDAVAIALGFAAQRVRELKAGT